MRVVVITEPEKYRKYKITEWYGIDPVQLKDDRWVVPEECITDIREFENFKENEVIFKAVELGGVFNKAEKVDVDEKEIKAEAVQIMR